MKRTIFALTAAVALGLTLPASAGDYRSADDYGAMVHKTGYYGDYRGGDYGYYPYRRHHRYGYYRSWWGGY